MSRINITPYAYIASGCVHMFRTCPKNIEQLPKELFGFGQTIYPRIFINRRGVRMIWSKFKIDPFWSLSEIVSMTKWINQNLSEYLKNHK